jgi:hypothetical protein
MCHIHSPFELSLREEVGQARTMVHVEVSHEDQVHIFRVDDVEIGEGLHSLLPRVDATVHEHLASFAFDVDAGAAHLVARAKGGDLQEVTTCRLDLMGLNGLVELLPQSLHIHYYLFIINIIIMVFKFLLVILGLILLHSV